MSIVVVGLNHRSAPLALLERIAVPAESHAKALAGLTALEHVVEAVVLSTCNRVEVYAHVTRYHPGVQELTHWLAERGDVHPGDLEGLTYAYHDDRAAAHLFAVAGGLDSMVIGEQQIAMQVRDVMELSRAEGTARRMLQRLFRQAVRVGRRIRRDTAIGAGASSMVDVGLEAATASLGLPLEGRTVCIVGAGKIGSITAARLEAAGAGRVLVWNRSADKAERLAARVAGEVVADRDLVTALAASDLVVCSTGAPEPVLDHDLVARAVEGRERTRPLVLLDLAMPRNVDPACERLPGVDVVDIADVRAVVERTVSAEVLTAAQDIVESEAARFLAWLNALEVEPTIRALRQRAEQVRAAELERFAARLAGLDPREREAVEALTQGLVNTLLHEPTVNLKRYADAGGAEHHTSALVELFDLDADAGERP